MLSIFRSNQAVTALPLFFYVVLLHLGALTGYVQPEAAAINPSLSYQSLFGWLDNSPFLSALIAVVLVYIQSVSVNILADRFRLLNDRNWLPGLAYALLSASLSDFLFVSPALVAATFVPFSIWRVLQCYKSSAATAYIFDAAFWLGVSAIFYPPSLFLLLAAYSGISVMRSFKAREHGVFLSGILTALLLAWLCWFWLDKGSVFRREQFADIFSLYHFNPNLSTLTLLKWGFLALLFLMVLLSMNGYGVRKTIEIQKSITAMFWYWSLALICVFLQKDPSRTHFLLSMAASGIFLSMTLSGLKNRMIAELLHFFMLAAILFIQFFPQS